MLATSTTSCRACASINERCSAAAAHTQCVARHTATLSLHSVPRNVPLNAADSRRSGLGCTTSVESRKEVKLSKWRTTSSTGSPHIVTEVHQEHACETSSSPANLRSFKAYYWPSIKIMSIRLAPDGTQMEQHALMWFDPNGFERLIVSYTKDSRIVWMELQMAPEEFSNTKDAWEALEQTQVPRGPGLSPKLDGIAEAACANDRLTITFRGSLAVHHTEPADVAANSDPEDQGLCDSRIMMGVDGEGRLASIIISDPANSVAGWTEGGQETRGAVVPGVPPTHLKQVSGCGKTCHMESFATIWNVVSSYSNTA